MKIIEDSPESVLSSFPAHPETQTSLFLLPHLGFYKVGSPESILKFHKPQEFHTETLNLECLPTTFGASNAAPTTIRFMNSGEVGFCTDLPVRKKSKAVTQCRICLGSNAYYIFFLYYTTFTPIT